jgi:hypothetical protein
METGVILPARVGHFLLTKHLLTTSRILLDA